MSSSQAFPPLTPPADAANRAAVAAEIARARSQTCRYIPGGVVVALVGHRLYLSNSVQVRRSPACSNVEVRQAFGDMAASLTPDRPGKYVLARASNERTCDVIAFHPGAIATMPEADLLALACDEKFAGEWELCTPSRPLPPSATPKTPTPKKGK
jgi:hypothetical protein